MKIKIKNIFLKNPVDLFQQNGFQQNGFQNMAFVIVALNEFKQLRSSSKVAYALVKSLIAVEKTIMELEATRIILCKSLCKKDDNGNPIEKNNRFQFPEQYICPVCEGSSEQELCEKCNVKSTLKISKERDELTDKHNELLQQETELDIFPIQISDIDGMQNIPIAAYETLLKFGFIQEEIEKKKPEIKTAEKLK